MTYQWELARTLDEIKAVTDTLADMWQVQDYGAPHGYLPVITRDDDTDITYAEIRDMMACVVDIERAALSIRYALRDIQDAIPPSDTE